LNFTPDDLNCHFLSVADKLAEALPLPSFSPMTFCSVASSTFHLCETSDSTVVSIINELESKKAAGFDGIIIKFIKAKPFSLGSLITRLVNFSIKSGSFPDLWKSAVVIPIQKTKESTELSNFRPIFILPVLSKVLERVVYDQLLSYLLKHNLLYERQSGFCPHYSTQDVLLNVTDSWHRAIDESKFTAAAFLDISKVFDCVNRV